MNLFSLYIDPGTGSALFAIVIGIATTVYFLVRGLLLKIGIIFFRNKKLNQSQYKYVIYAEDKRYWPFFESVLDEFEIRQKEVFYFTTSSDDPVFSSKYKYTKGKYIGSGNKAYAFLNFLSADFLLTTTPQIDVFHWKRSKNVKHYCHMVHGAGGPSLYRMFALDYFDSVLVANDNDVEEIRMIERIRNQKEKEIIITGNTFFDKYSEKLKELPKEENHCFTVLVSPSWGHNALLSVYGEKLLDPLSESGFHIIIRPHPQSLIVEKPMLDKLFEKYRNNPNIEWDYNNENLHSLSRADIMFSDFSAIIYDYAFLFNKPVIINLQNFDLRRFDAYYLEKESYYFEFTRKIGIELSGLNLSKLKESIINISHNIEMQNIREDIKKTMWRHQGEAAKRIADFMIQTVEKTNNIE